MLNASSLNNNTRFRWVEYIWADMEMQNIAHRGDYQATLEAVANLIAATTQKVGAGGTAARVGVGIPGAAWRWP